MDGELADDGLAGASRGRNQNTLAFGQRATGLFLKLIHRKLEQLHEAVD